MKKTGRKFKCIGLKSTNIVIWNKYFTIGKVYNQITNDSSGLFLKGNDDEDDDWGGWFVDKDQFELVEDE
jgi:hypothetical protein